MAKKTENKIKTTHETRILKCKLTEDEVREAADTLARLLDEHEAIEDAEKQVKADYKAQKEAKEASIRVHKNLVRNKYDHRPVRCRMEIDYTEQTVKVFRSDNEELVSERPMNNEEKQMDMGFDKE